MKKIQFILLFTVFVTVAYSQVNVSGYVIDALTKQPIEGAHIYFKNIPYGTISNAEGKFEISLKTESKDSVIISHLNYEQKIFPQSYFSEINTEVLLNVYITNLWDVVVTPLDPDKILQDVLDNFDDNYYPVSYEGVIKQTSYFEGSIKRLAVSSIILKKDKKESNLYLSNVEQFKNEAFNADKRISHYTGIGQIIDFTDLEKWLKNFKNNLSEFDEVYVDHGNYGKFSTYEIHLILYLTEEKRTHVTFVIEKESKAVLALDLKGDRGEGIDKWQTFYEKHDEKIARINTSGYSYIKFRPYKGKWMLSEIKAEGTARYEFEDENGIKTYKNNINQVHIVINDLNEEKVKRRNRVDPRKDLFNQISNQKEQRNSSSIKLTLEELEFLIQTIPY